MDNKLAENAYSAQKKGMGYEPSIIEANITFFAFMLLNAALFLLIPILYDKVNYDWCVLLAVVFLLFSVPLLVIGVKHAKNKPYFKVFYYFDFLFFSLSIFFSVLAIVIRTRTGFTLSQALVVFAVLASLCALDFLIMMVGKKERFLFSLLIIVFIAVIILACSTDKIPLLNGVGNAMLAYTIMFLIFHMTALLYIVLGEGFFILISTSYLFVAIVALIIALMVGCGDGCSADCGDCCDLPESGRRGKAKRMADQQMMQPPTP